MKSEIDEYVAGKIRKRRELMNISQETLSYLIDRCGSFVGQVEGGRSKYNVTHLNLIAMALKCSVKDFFPDEPLVPKKK